MARRGQVLWVLLCVSACGTGQVSSPGGGTGPPPTTNHPPVIQVPPSSSSGSVGSGEATQLSVTADDPDNDPLGFAWTQLSPPSPQGTFSARTVRNPTWAAPVVQADTTVVLQVTVVDGEGGSVTGTVSVDVASAQQNQPPTVSAITATPSAGVVAGDPLTLQVTATDPEGDPLTFTWTQTAPALQGTFSAPDQATTSWHSPALLSTLTFSFQVVVSDGINPSVQRTIDVQVRAPGYAADIQPIWNAHCTSCHPSDAQLDLTTGNSRGQLVDQTQVTGGGCAGQKRVDVSTPADSSLLGWLQGTTCGERMPKGAAALSSAELIKVQSWVLGGAPDS